MDVHINDQYKANGLPQMLSNILDFFQEYPNGEMIFICGEHGSKDGKHHAITGAIGDLHDIEHLLMGMFSTTLYEAYGKSYYEVFQLLKRLTHYTMDHFTEEDKIRLVRELDETLDKLIEETDGE